jgi:hypothetical protein
MRHASARSLTLSVVSDRQRAMTTPGGIDIASVHKGQCDRSRHLSSGLAVTPLARTVLLKKLQSAAWLLKSCNFCSGNGFTAWRRASCDAPWTSPCRRCGRQPGRLAHRSCGADLSGRASELAILAATAVKSAPPAMASIVPDRRMSAGGVRRYLAELARWPGVEGVVAEVADRAEHFQPVPERNDEISEMLIGQVGENGHIHSASNRAALAVSSDCSWSRVDR